MSPYTQGFKACTQFYSGLSTLKPQNPFPLDSFDYQQWKLGWHNSFWNKG